jgi:hypothetical protein
LQQRPAEALPAWMEERPHLAHLALRATHATPPPSYLKRCCPDRRGWLLLHYAVHCRFSAAVIKNIGTHWPHMARHVSDSGALPHHLMLRASIEEVTALVELHPEALRHRDHRGDLPLHSVMRWGVTPPVFRYLVGQHPQSLRASAGGGDSTVHLLAHCAGNLSVQSKPSSPASSAGPTHSRS